MECYFLSLPQRQEIGVCRKGEHIEREEEDPGPDLEEQKQGVGYGWYPAKDTEQK